MKQIYLPPIGGPLRWQDETSGVLANAINAFLNYGPDGSAITPEEVEIVRGYFEYYIYAPCWDHAVGAMFKLELAVLRDRTKTAKSYGDLSRWLWDALEFGLDPL